MIIVIQLEVLQTCGLIGSPTKYEPSLFENSMCLRVDMGYHIPDQWPIMLFW
jgi:hypothetical protein